MRTKPDLHAFECGTGPPVVLVHGWSFSGSCFAPQVDALRRCARVIVPDLRGHGRSAAPEDPGTLEDLASDVAELIERRAADGALLGGWSWGAQVALAALPLVRRRIAGLLLLSATPKFTAADDWPHGVPAANVRALSRRLGRDAGGTRRLFFDQMFADGEIDGAAREAIARSILEPAPAPDCARAGLAALAAADLRGSVAAARGIPALLVHGERDAVCLPAAAAWLRDRLPGARLEVIRGAGHAPHLTRAAEVNGLVEPFLESLA